MQTPVLVIFSLVGMAALAALSMAVYKSLPRSMLEGAGRHGRFADLGTPDRQPNDTASVVRSIGSNKLQGQSA